LEQEKLGRLYMYVIMCRYICKYVRIINACAEMDLNTILEKMENRESWREIINCSVASRFERRWRIVM